MRYLTQDVPSTLAQIKNSSVPRMLAYRNKEKGWRLWQITTKNNQ